MERLGYNNVTARVGDGYAVQILKVLTKTEDGLVIVSNVIPVRFVPLTRDEN